jgi:helix-hairpin-helix protein
METATDREQNGTPSAAVSNADIADRLASLAQLLSTQKENPYKVKAYHRAAARIRNLSESRDEMVRREEDLTQFSGIGVAIASAIAIVRILSHEVFSLPRARRYNGPQRYDLDCKRLLVTPRLLIFQTETLAVWQTTPRDKKANCCDLNQWSAERWDRNEF